MSDPDRLRTPSTASDRLLSDRPVWSRVLLRVVVVQAFTLLLLWLLQVRYG